LVRLPNGLVAAAAVIVGGRWAGASWWNPAVTLAAGSAVALTGVANAFNDYDDRAIDVIAHPERPIPSDAITPSLAVRVGAAAALLGIGLAAAATPALGAMSVVVVAVMLGYGRIKARSGVAANVIVATLGALPFLYGASAAGHPAAALPLLALAAPLHLAREVAKDVDDVDGDRGRRRTLPLVAGLSVARAVAVAAAGVAVLVLMIVGTRWRPPLMGALLLPAGLFALIGGWRLLRGSPGAATAFKVAMVLAIAVMLALPPR
jgi:geranylgeranylglycerol-phosphate geranylgeranyltransferase